MNKIRYANASHIEWFEFVRWVKLDKTLCCPPNDKPTRPVVRSPVHPIPPAILVIDAWLAYSRDDRVTTPLMTWPRVRWQLGARHVRWTTCVPRRRFHPSWRSLAGAFLKLYNSGGNGGSTWHPQNPSHVTNGF